MKNFLFFLIVIFSIMPIEAKIITGEVEYNNNQTGKNLYEYYIDKDNSNNINNILAGNVNLADKKLVSFSDGSYGVHYYSDPMYSWYYSNNGRLISFTRKDSLSYPCNVTRYKPDGTVLNKGYRISETESYIYSPQGKLLGHWVNDKCFDEFGNLLMVRKNMK